MSLAIIVINFRTPQYTLDCLTSLVQERDRFNPSGGRAPELQAPPCSSAALSRRSVGAKEDLSAEGRAPDFKVILIDNASGDDSVPRLREAIEKNGWGEWIIFMPQEKNLGFAGGNNVGFQWVLAQPDPPEFILLLNSDTIVHRGCLKASLARLAGDPGIGVMSCLLRNRDGTMQNNCRRFARPDRETVRALGLPYFFRGHFKWADLDDPEWNRETTARAVEWVIGAFMLMRTETVRRLGGLDESFFFYGEDTEFCFRLRRNGLRVFFDPAGSIIHLGGGSSDSTRLANRRKEILIWKARFHTQRRCYGWWAEWWIRSIYVAVFGTKVIFLTLTGQRDSDRFRGAISGWTVLTHRLEIPS